MNLERREPAAEMRGTNKEKVVRKCGKSVEPGEVLVLADSRQEAEPQQEADIEGLESLQQTSRGRQEANETAEEGQTQGKMTIEPQPSHRA
ncbi:hypothetical protein FQR65_LT05908 [Abscondita terminalis]|nr:hypothetical protein FQR65_LT05908 [Abscondita terminalis]